MKLINLLTAGLTLAAVSSTSLAQESEAKSEKSSERPNILFIFSDDHALDAIGVYSDRFKGIVDTPHLDSIAKQGAVFKNSFCANSICGPSRACILTGKHSHINGFRQNGDKFNGNQWTFPQALQKEGYQTAVIGKWHLHTLPVGFDYWQVLPGQGNYYNPDFRTMPEGKRERIKGYCTDIITDLSLKWLEKRDKTKPFMLMCQHKAPHRNWAPAPRHLNLLDGVKVPEPATLFDTYEGRSAWLKKHEMGLAKHFHWQHDMKFLSRSPFKGFADSVGNGEIARMDDKQRKAWDKAYEIENAQFVVDMKNKKLSEKQITSWKYQRYIKDYLSTIKAVDENVGRVLKFLKENDLEKNTIVIYSSDQGFYLGEHGWYDKRWMFEQSFKMPFLIKWPGVIKPNTKSETLIQNIDYAPTFLEIAGIKVPKEIQGMSMVPMFKNDCKPTANWRDDLYYAYWEGHRSIHAVPRHDGVRTDRYKIFFIPETQEWQLFDLVKDPQELKSVHDNSDYSKILEDMKKRYTANRQKFGSNHGKRK